MKRLVLMIAFFSLLAAPAHADGIVSMSFDDCTGPVTKAVLPGSQVDLYVSLIGQSEAHEAYQVALVLATHMPSDSGSFAPFPDAWRFEPTGCQGSSFLVLTPNPPAALSKGCPSFGPTPQVSSSDFYFDPFFRVARITVANSYNGRSADPGTRYHLAHLGFNQLYGVNGAGTPGATCGNLEQPMTIYIHSASWIDLASNEHSWAGGLAPSS